MPDYKPNLLSLWKKQTKDGKQFYSGELNLGGENKKIVIFFKDQGDTSNKPDIIIKESEPYNPQNARQQMRQGYNNQQIQQNIMQGLPAQPKQQQEIDVKVEDIPF